MTPVSPSTPSLAAAPQASLQEEAGWRPRHAMNGRRDRRALSPVRAYGSLERAFAACGLIAAAGTTGGAVLTVHGYGAAPLLGATSLALLLCAVLGIWAQERVIKFQRGEVARVYANALEAPRRAVFERRRAGPTRMETLSGAMTDFVESLRLTVFGGDHVRLWAVSMRRALEDRAQASQTLAAALGEDAHAIAAAATASRRAEAEISSGMSDLFGHAGRAAAATSSMADEADALQAAMHQTSAHLRQAASVAASLADTAMHARHGADTLGEAVGRLLGVAEQAGTILQQAADTGENAGARAALEAMMRAVHGLKADAAAMRQTIAVIGEGVQANGALGQAVSEAVSHQMEEAARVVAKAGLANAEIVSLQQRASEMERLELGLSAGPAARRAVERLPAHAEAIAKILRDLPKFEAAGTEG